MHQASGGTFNLFYFWVYLKVFFMFSGFFMPNFSCYACFEQKHYCLGKSHEWYLQLQRHPGWWLISLLVKGWSENFNRGGRPTLVALSHGPGSQIGLKKKASKSPFSDWMYRSQPHSTAQVTSGCTLRLWHRINSPLSCLISLPFIIIIIITTE